MDGACIEDLTVERLEAVHAIESSSSARPWSLASLARQLDNPRAIRLVALSQAGSLVKGFVLGVVAAGELEVHNVAVHKEHRRMGVARQLVAELLERGRRAGAREAWLEVRRSNRAARRLYEAFGFYGRGQRRGYYGDNGEDAVVMYRRLDEPQEAISGDRLCR